MLLFLGIKFSHEVGVVSVLNKGSEDQKLNQAVADKLGTQFQRLQASEYHVKFPYLNVQDCDEAWYESK